MLCFTRFVKKYIFTGGFLVFLFRLSTTHSVLGGCKCPMREEIETFLGCKQDSLRIVYEFRGDQSADAACGETANWSQRHNPFLGKGFNGKRVLECIACLARVHTWYAEVVCIDDVVATRSPLPLGVMFSLFNTAQHKDAVDITNSVATAYKKLSKCASNAPLFFQASVDLSFRVGGISFSSLWGLSAVEDSSRHHLFNAVCMFLPAATLGPYDCCEMHRCVSYVSGSTVKSASVSKPYWFYTPLTWLDAACGVHDDDFYHTERGERFKAVVPSALTELECAVLYASQFRCGSDAHLRLLSAFKKAPRSCRKSFFGAKAYYLSALSSLFIAWSSRNSTREDVAEMVAFLTGLLPFIPAPMLQDALYEMYTRFESEWQCATAQVVTTTILLLAARAHAATLAETVSVLVKRGRCESNDVHVLVQDFVGTEHTLSTASSNVVTRLLTMTDTYISAEAWWYDVVMCNIENILKMDPGNQNELGTQLQRAFVCPTCVKGDATEGLAICGNFGCVVRNWRAFIDDEQVLARFDVFVKATSLGANPFWYFQVPQRCLRCPVHAIDPLELIVVCSIACCTEERCLAFWKTYTKGSRRNARAFAACLNNWTPLRVGYPYALQALKAVMASEESEELLSELHGRWRKIMLSAQMCKVGV